MITFLFWNLNQQPLESHIARLASRHRVDVIILAECAILERVMTNELYRQTGRRFHLPFSICEKIRIFTGFPKRFLKAKCEKERFTIRRLNLPEVDEILIVATHFPSKLYWSREDQAQECSRLAEEIRREEENAGHSRTLLVGDLNMNPFEDGVVGATGLHGVMTKEIAARQGRVVQDRKYSFFYNPMWNFFGDATEGPPGTYYDRRSGHVCFFWNMFDQILLRPGLMPFFENEELRILTDDGETSLVSTKGFPDAAKASDHLPILFRLNF